MMNELTAMQAACWSGRSLQGALGGVAAHLYVEFDGRDIDPERLEQALACAAARHPMLRLRIDADGVPSVMPPEAGPGLEIDDLRPLPADAADARLLEKRQQWTHQKLDLAAGQSARFSLSLRGGGACRLHVDTDMVAIDPASFCVLMEDLAVLYERPAQALPAAPSWLVWREREHSDPALGALRDRDRAWWQARIPDIPPAPTLPAAPPGAPRSHRLAVTLSTAEHRALRRLARSRSITQATLMLGLFSLVLAKHTGDRRFRLNVPLFWRNPLVANVERIVGDFANVTLLGVALDDADSPAALCARIGEQMAGLLAHSAWPGVNVMRSLSRLHGGTQLAPVVVTAALDLPGGTLLSPRVGRQFGEMNWAISQGPQVALDAQFAAVERGLLINWDIRLDALPEAWVTAMFDDFVACVRNIAAQPEGFDLPIVPYEGRASGTQSRVLAVYREVLCLPDDATFGGTCDLIGLGLRPRHFKTLASRLDDEFGITLTAAQLLRCRNVDEVVRLLPAGIGIKDDK